MRSVPKMGTTGEVAFTVEKDHAIDFADSAMPAVLSTPWLIWFLEHAAREAVLPHLEPGESTVGIHVDVQHLAPTPLGDRVTCRARLLRAEGTRFSFQLEAFDSQERIARGFHQLRVISVGRFRSRVEKKARSSTS